MIEREALGMVFALQKYRHYLLDNPFIFYMDKQALKYLVINLYIMEESVIGCFCSKNLSSKLYSDWEG